MNYIFEIKAFEQWLETHYLPIQPQLLWYKLMYFCNRSGWSEWVTVDNLRLMAAMQMSREATLIKARGELIKAGLIEYQKGKKGSPNRYRMISLVEKNTFKSEVQNEGKAKNTFKNVVQNKVYQVGESEVQNEVYQVGESVAIYKQKQELKQKQNKNTMCKADASALFEQLWTIYPCKKGKGQVSDAKKKKLFEIGFDEMSRAIERYLEDLKKDAWRKPQNGSTFFNSGYIDYLDANYNSPSEKQPVEKRAVQKKEENQGEELIDDEEWWKYGPNALEE